MNGQIKAREIRVISPDGKQLGVMPLREGLRLAAERNMDLVEVAPTARPPVCRIMDYGKYRYEQSKRDREAKKRQKVISVKEVRMSPKIDEHDFQVKARNAERFLKDGDKVKVSVRFRGREIVHAELADKRLGELAGLVRDYGVVESPPKLEGRHMVMILAPKQD
ncbi:MAG: translation initiation factor IF-3 [Firmicutes bacterium]|nr:translation initiation factor IF-3 [Bacillota bacterium]